MSQEEAAHLLYAVKPSHSAGGTERRQVHLGSTSQALDVTVNMSVCDRRKWKPLCPKFQSRRESSKDVAGGEAREEGESVKSGGRYSG